MKQVQATVRASIEPMPGVRLITLHAPSVAATAQPGQFVHVRCGAGFDPLLRRPISMHRCHRTGASWGSSGELTLLFEVVGRGTRQLAALRPGETLDLIGPLGRGFSLEQTTRRLLLVAGGLGVAPLVSAADAALRADAEVTLLAGAQVATGLLPSPLLPAEVEYVVATEDGSRGHRGLVTDLLAEYLAWADQVFVCGPWGMVETIAGLAVGHRSRIQVSLEERMACGVGACLGCVVQTRRGQLRVCRDGPVFKLKDVLT